MSQIKINSKNIIIVEWNEEFSIIKNNHTYIKSIGFPTKRKSLEKVIYLI